MQIPENEQIWITNNKGEKIAFDNVSKEKIHYILELFNLDVAELKKPIYTKEEMSNEYDHGYEKGYAIGYDEGYNDGRTGVELD